MSLCRTVILMIVIAAVGAQLRRKTNGYDTQTCKTKCGQFERCVVQEVCVPVPTCTTTKCKDNEYCEDTPAGPTCKPKTCAHIRCAAGTLCENSDDGPDCVPDVPSCKDYFCRRGTNCYIRAGSPVCLPNTCEVRVCHPSLTCIDTKNGALCRRGEKTLPCSRKYCPHNSVCKTGEDGPVCKIQKE